MGLFGPEADNYAQSFMTTMVAGRGIACLAEKVREDLEAAGAMPDIAAIEPTVATLTARAAAEVRAEAHESEPRASKIRGPAPTRPPNHDC